MTTKHTRAILAALEPLLALRGTSLDAVLADLLEAETQALRSPAKPRQAVPPPPGPSIVPPASMGPPEAFAPYTPLPTPAPLVNPLAGLDATELPRDYSPPAYKAPQRPADPPPAPAHVHPHRRALCSLQDVFPEVTEGEAYDLLSPGSPVTTDGPYWLAAAAYNNLDYLLGALDAELLPHPYKEKYESLEALGITDSNQRMNLWRTKGYGVVYQPLDPKGSYVVTDEFYDSLFRAAKTRVEYEHRLHVLGSLPIDYERKIRAHRDITKRGRALSLPKCHRDGPLPEQTGNFPLRIHPATDASPAALDADFVKRLLNPTEEEYRDMFNTARPWDPSRSDNADD